MHRFHTTAVELRERFALTILAGLRRRDGQTLVEYSLILTFVALVVIGVITALGGTISSVFSNTASAI
jgi:Flp pilus assembly pilin Flp